MVDAQQPDEESLTWMSSLAGRFIVFDGPDGSGKSTQFARFGQTCRQQGIIVRDVREPGGTEIGEQIRRILLDPQNAGMAVTCEMLLYMASRAQLIEQVIGPALARNELVLADRFVSSTLAYQGTAGGMNAADIRAVGNIAIGRHQPDLTIIFDVDEQTAASRLNPLLDRMELKGAAFHKRVRQGFLDQAATDPEHFMVIDARGDADEVYDRLTDQLANRLNR